MQQHIEDSSCLESCSQFGHLPWCRWCRQPSVTAGGTALLSSMLATASRADLPLVQQLHRAGPQLGAKRDGLAGTAESSAEHCAVALLAAHCLASLLACSQKAACKVGRRAIRQGAAFQGAARAHKNCAGPWC